ncbi:MAG TPA: alpha/beta hydrolase [Thermomicrobiales bacterium]|nr:alpha/beta hydrolase [Thermomicrobiales bacterium]
MNRRSFIAGTAASGLTLATSITALANATPNTSVGEEGTPMTPPQQPQTGYAPVNGLEMYYEIHGTGGTPLLLLHGGLFNIDLQFGELIPGLSEHRQVIAVDFQGHGRTNDIDGRPLSTANLTSDIVALLEYLEVERVDVFGYSIGGAVTLALAIQHPELVRKVVVSSVSFHPDGDRQENQDAVGEMTVDMIAGTPMEQDYLAKSPNPDKLQVLLDKLGAYDDGNGWTEEEIGAYPAPTLFTVGDCDAVRLDHAVRFLQLRGGDVNGDFVGVPASQLAVLPGTTHFFGLSRPSLVLELVVPFLDAPMPEGQGS